MKKYFFITFALAFIGILVYSFSEAGIKNNTNTITATQKNFYDYSIKSLDGKSDLKMADLKGKYILCVNVASECGYTKQYETLQKLHLYILDPLLNHILERVFPYIVLTCVLFGLLLILAMCTFAVVLLQMKNASGPMNVFHPG